MLTVEKENINIDLDTQKWDSACNIFCNEFGEGIYYGWINNLNLVSVSEFEIIMSVPTVFIRDWILKEYFNGKFKNVNGNMVCIKKGIKQILVDIFPNLVSFQIIIDKNITVKETKENINNVQSLSKNNNLYNIGIQLNDNYIFDNYVVGSSNKLAYQVAMNISTNTSVDLNTNPFFIYGNVGLGKTHLCQAMAWKMKETHPHKQIVYLSAEKFMYLFVQSLQEQDVNTFKNKFRNIDVLIIDDIQFIIGKEKTQKEFFYTFETLVNDNKQVILACDRSPLNLINLDEKLKSRINGGLVVDIKEPDYEFRLNLINKKASMLKLDLSKPLMSYMAEKIILNNREIEGCLKRLQINQDIMNIKISKEDIDNILHDNIISSQKCITINDIQDKISNYFNISIADLKSIKRLKELVIPRHIAMYFCKQLTTKSYPEIAKSFNGKNHATVIYAVKKIEELIEKDLEIANIIEEIKHIFK